MYNGQFGSHVALIMRRWAARIPRARYAGTDSSAYTATQAPSNLRSRGQRERRLRLVLSDHRESSRPHACHLWC